MSRLHRLSVVLLAGMLIDPHRSVGTVRQAAQAQEHRQVRVMEGLHLSPNCYRRHGSNRLISQ